MTHAVLLSLVRKYLLYSIIIQISCTSEVYSDQLTYASPFTVLPLRYTEIPAASHLSYHLCPRPRPTHNRPRLIPSLIFSPADEIPSFMFSPADEILSFMFSPAKVNPIFWLSPAAVRPFAAKLLGVRK